MYRVTLTDRDGHVIKVLDPIAKNDLPAIYAELFARWPAADHYIFLNRHRDTGRG